MPRVLFGFTPPKNHRGVGDIPTGGFSSWLSNQSTDVQNAVSDYQAANPSDYAPLIVASSIPSWVLMLGVGLAAVAFIKAGK